MKNLSCLSLILAVAIAVGCDSGDDVELGGLTGQVVLQAEVTHANRQHTGEYATRGVTGATVTLMADEGDSMAVFTNAAGRFTFSRVAAGSYSLRTSAVDGRVKAEQRVQLGPGDDVDLIEPLVLWSEPSGIDVAPNPGLFITTCFFQNPTAGPVTKIVYDGGGVVSTSQSTLPAGVVGWNWYFMDEDSSPVYGEAFWLLLQHEGGERIAALLRETPPAEIPFPCGLTIEQNWSDAKWREALNSGALEPFFPEYGPGTQPEDVPLYVSAEEDRLTWLTNTLEWDVFAWGWREYWDRNWNAVTHPDFIGPGFYDPQSGLPGTWFFPDESLNTPLRNEARTFCEVE